MAGEPLLEDGTGGVGGLDHDLQIGGKGVGVLEHRSPVNLIQTHNLQSFWKQNMQESTFINTPPTPTPIQFGPQKCTFWKNASTETIAISQ